MRVAALCETTIPERVLVGRADADPLDWGEPSHSGLELDAAEPAYAR